MDHRKWEDPDIEDWEDDSEFRSEDERQLFIGFGFGGFGGFGCSPRRFCWPRQGCWPRESCWPRHGCWPRGSCWPRHGCWPR
jgi:hypothetical protein